MPQATIEIKGKHYDASTGKLVSKATPAKKILRFKGQALDGVTRRPVQLAKRIHQKSQTLMRNTVKKPLSATSDLKPLTQTSILTNPDPYNLSHGNVNLRRAKTVHKSRFIKRFSDFSSPIHKTMPTAVAPNAMAIKPAPTPLRLSWSAKRNLLTRNKGEEAFKKGLVKADAHTAKPLPKTSTRDRVAKRFGTSTKLITGSAVGLVFLVIGVLFAYQNIPSFAMKVAAARAGVHASLPNYSPSGFAIAGPIEYANGQVTVHFKANADKRSFSISQKNSNWNSESLLSNYVANKADQYQTYSDKGQTIYMYSGTKATWVNGGVWYNLNSNADLSSDQLVRIATSM